MRLLDMRKNTTTELEKEFTRLDLRLSNVDARLSEITQAHIFNRPVDKNEEMDLLLEMADIKESKKWIVFELNRRNGRKGGRIEEAL